MDRWGPSLFAASRLIREWGKDMKKYSMRKPSIISAQRARAPKVIIGVAASDAHVVANRLMAIYLKENGFNVINLGVCTPLNEFVEAWQKNQDCLAIIISSLNGHAYQDLQGLSLAKQDYQIRCPIILGGNLSVGAMKDVNLHKQFSQLGIDQILTDIEDIVPLLNSFLEEKSHHIPPQTKYWQLEESL